MNAKNILRLIKSFLNKRNKQFPNKLLILSGHGEADTGKFAVNY